MSQIPRSELDPSLWRTIQGGVESVLLSYIAVGILILGLGGDERLGRIWPVGLGLVIIGVLGLTAEHYIVKRRKK